MFSLEVARRVRAYTLLGSYSPTSLSTLVCDYGESFTDCAFERPIAESCIILSSTSKERYTLPPEYILVSGSNVDLLLLPVNAGLANE